ncbi:hypothetical protein ABID22_003203 [Pontibacter aydingkolensis]
MTQNEMEASMIAKSMAYYQNNISKVARARSKKSSIIPLP